MLLLIILLLHQTRTHNTAECRAASTAGVTTPNKFCRNCGAPGWSREHRCNTATRATNSELAATTTPRFAAMYINDASVNDSIGGAVDGFSHPQQVSGPHANTVFNNSSPTITSGPHANVDVYSQQPSYSLAAATIATSPVVTTAANVPIPTVAYENMDVDSNTELQEIIAEQAQKCKTHPTFSMPPNNKSNMIIIPIIIQDIKTYALTSNQYLVTFNSVMLRVMCLVKVKSN